MERTTISFTDTLKSPDLHKSGDDGYQQVITYLEGNILVELDGKEVLVKNQGLYQSIYTLKFNDVHHSKMPLPNIRAATSVAENAEIVFFPYSIDICDMQGRLRMKAGKSEFHYHNGRQARLVLAGEVTMQWIQLNELHEVTLGVDDWIVLPANTPYRTIVRDHVDMLSNWIGHPERMTENKVNTIGRFRKAT